MTHGPHPPPDELPTLPLPPPSLPLRWRPPTAFAEYRVLHRIGAGGMGQVYLGQDLLLARPVAIKFISAPDPSPEAHQRFLTEARAIARLQHPNVVSVFRVGQIDGHPYLVSELIRGRSLDLIDKPLSWTRALHIGVGLSRGLAAAHREGVLHRDIKPGNVMLTDQDEVKLVDFGIAKFTDSDLDPPPLPQELTPTTDSAQRSGAPSIDAGRTQVGVVIGTPMYLAPELVTGAPATRRSDIFAVGLLLYELCAGSLPGTQPDPLDESGATRDVPLGGPPSQTARDPELGTAGPNADVPPLLEAAPDVPPAFAAVVDRCLCRHPDGRYGSADDLREDLERLLPGRALPIPPGNPYRGLMAFEAEHRALFFGRGQDVRALLERLRAAPLVAVAGDSGVGKSSLCRAGVLPLIEDGAMGDGRRYEARILIPGLRPLLALAEALALVLGAVPQELVEQLQRDPAGVVRLLRARFRQGHGVALLVDQAEELVTISDPAQAAVVDGFLGAVLDGERSCLLLLSARADFLTRLALLPHLGQELFRALYLVRALSATGVREAICGPAESQGVRFESDELVEDLARAAGPSPGALPLLQFTLAELWERRDEGRRVIPAQALARLGGVAGALAHHADAVLSAMPPPLQRHARRILLSLVGAQGTRARRTGGDLGADALEPVTPEAHAAREALEALVRGRLVVARQGESGDLYELAHEALVHGWGTLRGWLDEASEQRALLRRLEHAAAEWARLGHDRGALWQERQLAEAAPLVTSELPADEASFIRASRRQALRRRIGRGLLAAALPVVLATVSAGVRLRAAWETGQRVQAHVRQAEAPLRAARQRRERGEVERQRCFALLDQAAQTVAAGGDGGPRLYESAERSWTAARAQYEEAERGYRTGMRALEDALTLDPGHERVRRLLADLLFDRLLISERLQKTEHQEDLEARLRQFDDSGALRARLSTPAAIELRTRPPEAAVEVTTYQRAGARLLEVAVTPAPAGPPLQLPPGSYVLALRAAGRAPTRLALQVGPGERLTLSVDLPRTAAVPAGYVYVPAGLALLGSADDEGLRRGFLNAPPLRPVWTAGYLIGRTEVRFMDWLAFLRALPQDERQRRMPQSAGLQGRLSLTAQPDGKYRLVLQPAAIEYSAREGEPIRYPGRTLRREQDWLKFPVSGISFEDAQAYAAWLDRTGQLKGARLCDEHEWERAARGADGRQYPGGDVLSADDANYDETYGRNPAGFGPDEVGAHPASDSPFGISDLSGNVWEWTRSVRAAGEAAFRGGSWYQGDLTNRPTNREVGEPTMRNLLVGARICAPAPPP